MKQTLSILSVAIIAALLCGCGLIQGSGNIVSESRAVSGFTQVALEGSGDLFITQGEEEGLVIEADDNLLPYIQTEVRNGTLHIGVKSPTSAIPWPTQTIRYHLSMKTVEAVKLYGSGNIFSESIAAEDVKFLIAGSGDIRIGELQADAVDTSISGSGTLRIDQVTAEAMETTISGSGKFFLAGRVTDQQIAISGSGDYKAFDLESQTVSLKISGSGDIELWVTESLDIHISGSGDVRYYGSPASSQRVSGSGDISSLGSR